jgi:hypothetical protein
MTQPAVTRPAVAQPAVLQPVRPDQSLLAPPENKASIDTVELRLLVGELRKQMAELTHRREALEQQVSAVLKRLDGLQEQRPKQPLLPLPEDAEFRPYRLRFTKAEQAARAVAQLADGSSIRIAVVPEQNVLLIAANKDQMKMAHELLTALDQPAAGEGPLTEDATTAVVHTASPQEIAAAATKIVGNANVQISAIVGAQVVVVRGREGEVRRILEVLKQIERASEEQTRTPGTSMLQVRLVWVTNSSKWASVSPPEEYLDRRVLESLKPIGIANPNIMCVQFASVAAGAKPAKVEFSSPAVLDGNNVLFGGDASIGINQNGRVKLELSSSAVTTIESPPGQFRSYTGRINGSIVTPLRNYVILGTTNVVVRDFSKDSLDLKSIPAALVLYVAGADPPE